MEEKNIYLEHIEVKKKKEVLEKYRKYMFRNLSIVIMLAAAIVISLINIYSASFYNVGMKNKYLLQHFYYIICAIAFLLFSCRIHYNTYNSDNKMRAMLLIVIIIFAAMKVLSYVAPQIVPKINGATGWIRVPGVGGIQPAEIFKIVFVMLFAHRLSISEKERHKDFEIIKFNWVIPVIFAVCIHFQNDLGTLIHYFLIYVFMLFMTRIAMKYIVWLAGIGGVVGVISMLYVYFTDFTASGYKILRIKSFLVGLISNYYDNDKGYQVRQSLIGVGSGGIFGKGYGNGIQKYSYLPEIHTDFIFTSYAEEFGFVGVLGLIFIMISLFSLIKYTAIDCEDQFGKYLAIGIGGYFLLQFLINISVAIGLLPVFGIPMPLMSFGGSSLVSLFFSFGIILNINYQNALKIKRENNL